MSNKIEILYDDRALVTPLVEAIVGKRCYGEIIHQKKKLSELALTTARLVGADFYHVRNDEEFFRFSSSLSAKLTNLKTSVVYHRASAAIISCDAYVHLLRKISYAQIDLVNEQLSPSFAVFANLESWELFINKQFRNGELFKLIDSELVEIEHALAEISSSSVLLSLLSGIFEARHFNSIQGDENIIVKTSNNILKIRSEYEYHYLLPESIRYWFVPPFNFKESNGSASYTMERLHITNMALGWIHGAHNRVEFDRFLGRVFCFLKERPKRKALNKNNSIELYVKKVESRFASLKLNKFYPMLDSMVRSGVDPEGLNGLMDRYYALATTILSKDKSEEEAVSHGDLCFSNILYDKQTNHIRFIDPRGAVNESELWLDSYYDVAKLSHSIMGNYDFMCYSRFSISVEDDLLLSLKIESENIEALKNLFLERLNEAGFDPLKVRLCEASLFLSMLPLHSDNLKRILSFILNANSILKELEANV